MAIELANKQNVEAPSVTYEFGSIKDNPGDQTGTPFDRAVYSDFHQWASKMFANSGLTYNNLPDNTTNGYQFYEAMRENIAKYKSITIYGGNTTLTQANIGGIAGYFNFFGGATFTLPDALNEDTGKKLTVINLVPYDLTILPFGGNFINPVPTPNPLILKQGDSINFYIGITGQWIITSIYRKANAEVLTKIIPIGDWDMSATGTLTVAHGLTLSKIRSVSAMINIDTSNAVYPLTGFINNTPGGSAYADATNINLFRFSDAQANLINGALSAYENGSYSATGFNRGWITIEYVL